jgi:putative salt-induced outer membrane protein YdiY
MNLARCTPNAGASSSAAVTDRLLPLHLLCPFLFVVCWCVFSLAHADVLVGVNGERFVGRVLEETAETVVFQSETGGRLTVPRIRILELQRAPTAQPGQTNPAPAAVSLQTTNTTWRPPGIGRDGFDWLQLKSGEWLKGYLHYLHDKKVHFESDELEDLSLKLKDVRQFYSGKPMFTKFDGRDQIFGNVALSNGLVEVVGPEQLQLPRGLLQGITPGGKREIDFWSGRATIGLNLQSGNTEQSTMNASAELARRTPATQFLVNYLGNFSEVDGTENANNHRVNLSYDVRLSHDWFVRPVQLEYYRDQLANIAHRVTGGVGIGYYIFDRDDLEWKAAAGPGYQYTRFETVAPGESVSASTPAGIFQTRFKADITSRLTFIQSFAGTVTTESAGLYNHHAVTTLEFEIKRFLDLDLSFVWDYLQNPQTEASGVVPKRTDLRLTLGIGAKF